MSYYTAGNNPQASTNLLAAAIAHQLGIDLHQVVELDVRSRAGETPYVTAEFHMTNAQLTAAVQAVTTNVTAKKDTE